MLYQIFLLPQVRRSVAWSLIINYVTQVLISAPEQRKTLLFKTEIRIHQQTPRPYYIYTEIYPSAQPQLQNGNPANKYPYTYIHTHGNIHTYGNGSRKNKKKFLSVKFQGVATSNLHNKENHSLAPPRNIPPQKRIFEQD